MRYSGKNNKTSDLRYHRVHGSILTLLYHREWRKITVVNYQFIRYHRQLFSLPCEEQDHHPCEEQGCWSAVTFHPEVSSVARRLRHIYKWWLNIRTCGRNSSDSEPSKPPKSSGRWRLWILSWNTRGSSGDKTGAPWHLRICSGDGRTSVWGSVSVLGDSSLK